MDIRDKNYIDYAEEKLAEYRGNGKPTVAYFIDTYFPLVDGVVSVLHNYATHLQKDWNVIVCAPAHRHKQQEQDYLVLSCNSHYLKFINYSYGTPAADRRFVGLLEQAKIDLVHLHSPFMLGAFGLRLAKKRNIPVIATFHSQYKQDFMRYTKSKVVTNFLLESIMKVFRQTDCVYTMHEYSKNTLLSYGYDGEVRFLPNATNERYPEDPAPYLARVNEAYNLGDKKNILLFVGRITRVKDIFFILEILDKLPAEFPFHMIFVGGGPDEKELQKRTEELGLSDRVTFTGNIGDRELLKAFYLRSDLFLFPSRYDVSSIVQIEAAAQKLCGLFRRGSVTSCTVRDNETGFLCEGGAEDFADKILEIFSTPGLLARVSEGAHEKLYVSWENLTQKILSEYDFILQKPRPVAEERGARKSKRTSEE